MPTPFSPTTRFAAASAPGGLPLLGHAAALLHRPHEFVAGLPAHGDLVRLRLGPLRAYVVCHPELVRRLLADDRTFRPGGPLPDRAREAFGDGLAAFPATAHRHRPPPPALHHGRLPDHAAPMAEGIADATARWRDGDVIDVPAAMCRLSTAVTARCLTAAHERAGSPPPGADRLTSPGNRLRRARQDLREFTRRLTADHRAAGTDRHDLPSTPLAAPDEDGRPPSGAEVHERLAAFLPAGPESTAATLSWAWTLLAANPAVRMRLHTELDTVLDGRPARLEDLPALPLTARIVSETLRLYPPPWILSRTATTDTELGGHPVPAGATLLYSPYLLHRRADLFPRPDRFDPDRWLTTARPAPGARTPFGLGAHRSAGDAFGTATAVLAIATIAAHWTIAPTPGRPVRPTRGPSLAPRPFTATLTRRVR
ncbi:cytochrome P450 [Kitasatospora sp. NPDC001547]|uniref:cytochrome P450 n=1 Tax=Kitasatospora sp. NPDC001547 TaxID=3364015 RepID=UPI0036782BEF